MLIEGGSMIYCSVCHVSNDNDDSVANLYIGEDYNEAVKVLACLGRNITLEEYGWENEVICLKVIEHWDNGKKVKSDFLHF